MWDLVPLGFEPRPLHREHGELAPGPPGKSHFVVIAVQSVNHVHLFVTPRTAALRLLSPPLSPGVCSNYVHWVSDTSQSSHLPPPPPSLAINLSQLRGLFQWVSSLPQVHGSFFYPHISTPYRICWPMTAIRRLACLYTFSSVFSSASCFVIALFYIVKIPNNYVQPHNCFSSVLY